MKGVKVKLDIVKNVLKSLKDLDNDRLLVGVPMDENARDDDPIGNAQIGYINEYGSEAANIPPAPHLEPGVDAIADKCADIIADGISSALSGKPDALKKAYNRAGLVAQASVRRHITSQDGFEDLSESTLEARERAGFKGTKRLIWTGQYRNSITYVIRSKNGRS